MDIIWISDSAILVQKWADSEQKFEVTEIGGTRRCTITYSPEGRMLFNGEDIETEDFMCLVGMLDVVAESPVGMAAFSDDTVINR